MTESKDASRLDQLAYELEVAKKNEMEAKLCRVNLEEQLCAVVGVKDEGSLSTTGDYYKVTTTAGFTRTLDADKWDAIKDDLPLNVSAQVVRYKPDINVRQLKNLQELDPALYSVVAEAITTKPRKTSVKFERLEK